MAPTPHELADQLAAQAEAVCRHYLGNGRRQGRYWIVGDARNTPGRSMFVRLHPSPRGRAGKWSDAATGEHGDLLDIIRESCSVSTFATAMDEARRFLSLPATTAVAPTYIENVPVRTGSPAAARRLFAMAQPIAGTLAETYLRHRAITALHGTASLRFHPHCYYRSEDSGSTETWPAMIAMVTDLHGRQTGAHRTWLSRDGMNKAPVNTPRRAMGELLGHAVRFGMPGSVMAVGEGIETVLSLRCVLPTMPMTAALSAGHLAAILFPPTLRRLYIIRDNDPAGDHARDRLVERAHETGIEPIALTPHMADFNDDLRHLGLSCLRVSIAGQLLRRDRHIYPARTV